MLGSNYPSDYSLPPYDGEHLLDSVKEFLSDADVTFGNLEGTLLNAGGTPKKCHTPENCVAFRMPEYYAGYLKDAGFDLLSNANNHSNDMGEEGRVSTLKTLDEYDIKYAGYDYYPVTIFVKDGVKFGFAAFAPNTGTVPLNDIPNAVKIVSKLKKECDIVIVSFHGGAEGTGAQRVTGEREIFLGEDRGNVYEFAHSVVDSGADIVFGQGPHVARALELYRDRLIAYSLGNFCTYGKFGLSGALGVAPILKVYINKTGEFMSGDIISIRQMGKGMPVLDYENNALDIIQKLTALDFPETGLVFYDDGDVEKAEQ
jgi:hypothetical protein